MSEETTISVKDWLITLIVAAIPVINIIMLFVWGFGSGTPASKANWAKAALLLVAISAVLYFIIFIAILGGAAASGAFN